MLSTTTVYPPPEPAPKKSRYARYSQVKRPKPFTRANEQRIFTVLMLLYHYGILTAEQVSRLLGLAASTTNELLLQMYQHKYVAREYEATRPDEPTSPAYYVLRYRGIMRLRSNRFADFKPIPVAAEHVNPSPHTRAINDVRIAASIACFELGWDLEDWENERQIKADHERVAIETSPGKMRQQSVRADLYCSLVPVPYPRRYPLFWEIDCATMRPLDFKRKILAYREFVKPLRDATSRYQRRYGHKSLKVLTVVAHKTPALEMERLLALKRVTEHATGEEWFLFSTLSELNEETVFTAPIWRAANRQISQPLIAVD